jgi:hypothetical protein
MADEKLLKAIGEVTAEAAAVEYAVAYLVILARGQSEEELSTVLGSIGRPRRELEHLQKDVAKGGEATKELSEDLRRLPTTLP